MAGKRTSHLHTRLIDRANKLRLISFQSAKVSILAEIRLDCDVETCDIYVGDCDWSLDRHCV